jgi:flagellar L-ring protein precursor FlgH
MTALKKIQGRLFWVLLALSGCNFVERLAEVGNAPQLSTIHDPTKLPNYHPITMPMPAPEVRLQNKANSLWEPGSRAFFKDQRANKVGDVLTVFVDMDQREQIEMKPLIDQDTSTNMSVNSLFGLEYTIPKALFNRNRQMNAANNPNGQNNKQTLQDPKWMDLNSHPTLKGDARYDVRDRIKFKIATTVIQTLPNGNMVIQGRQEIRLVNEVREIELRGIIRREDISLNNSIPGDKIAELRILYAGRGDLTDAQSAPWGQQVINRLKPF